MRSIRKLFIILMPLAFYSSCGDTPSVSQAQSDPEESYCSPLAEGARSMTFTGKAYYQARLVTDDGLVGNSGNLPIRFAEVRIYKKDAIAQKGLTNSLVQCGETNASGEFSLKLPKASGTYVVKVTSRANNDKIKASVLNNPQDNDYYFIQTTVNSSGSNVALASDALVASYKGDTIGGAFNILDQIYKSNEFFREKTAETDCATCEMVFKVAPKANVYWTPGRSPTEYGGGGDSSYFLPSTGALYILGGYGGDMQYEDTDHFDNCVIIHEYGHFIEHTLSQSDSPGGPHNGDSVIDARLAWSEGWGYFIQAAILNQNYCKDTTGYGDDSSLILNASTEEASRDQAQAQGEGNFREFSIVRTLWDFIDADVDTDAGYAENAQISFRYIWEALTNPDIGFRSDSHHYRNVGHFYEILFALVEDNEPAKVAALQTVLANEKHEPSRKDYASLMATTGCSGVQTFDMSPIFMGNSGFDASHQFASNDFFAYYHSGGSLDLVLRYDQQNGGAPNPSDLDLYLYGDNYVFDADYTDMLGYSEDLWSKEEGQERLVISKLARGTYLINVKAYTTKYSADDVTYELAANNVPLCQQ